MFLHGKLLFVCDGQRKMQMIKIVENIGNLAKILKLQLLIELID